jgi:hypothetical protein
MIAHFKHEMTIQPTRKQFDFAIAAYNAACDKSSPKMCLRVLKILEVGSVIRFDR